MKIRFRESYILIHVVRLSVCLWPLDAQTKGPLDAERSDEKKKSDRWTQREVTGRRCHDRRMQSVRASKSRNHDSGPRRTGLSFFFFFFFFRPKVPWSMLFRILGYGFQDMVFGTWDLNFGAWKILGYGFQDMVFWTWDLNFGACIFTLAVSKIETWKL